MDTGRLAIARYLIVAAILSYLADRSRALPQLPVRYDANERSSSPRNGRTRDVVISEESPYYVDYESSIGPMPGKARPNVCNNCVCGIGSRQMRIVGGNVTELHEFPWMASFSRRGTFYCAGSLVTRRHILTAAHCLEGFKNRDIQIVLGDHNRADRRETVVRRRIKTSHIHENFDVYSYNNDIALIELDSPVNFDAVVRPACLPENWAIDYTGAMAVAAGWGQTGEHENVSNSLRKVNLPILSDEECSMARYDKKRLTSNMFCAGYLEGQHDACQGDSGGPLHVTGTKGQLEVIGIISWGRGCARPLFPGVFTKVTNYLGWLRKHLDGECVCPPPQTSVLASAIGGSRSIDLSRS